MKEVNHMKSNRKSLLKVIRLTILVFCFSACVNNSIVPESEYSAKIIGSWQGTVGDMKETMSIKNDSTFVCQIHPRGFIANTLSQSVTGTIIGTWNITGAIITLRITGAKNERLANRVTLSTIITFKKDELVLKSDNGKTSSFIRMQTI